MNPKSNTTVSHLAGQSEPAERCITVSVGVSRGDNSDYVLLAIEPKGEPVRRMRLSIGGADVLSAELGGLLYGEPAPDLAGQGEPVAWVYEAWNTFDEHWFPIFASVEPAPHPHRRNIRPLYAAPAPSRPADREETLETIAEWCEQTFGAIEPARIVSRAGEEMDELRAEPTRVEEAADVVIVLSRYPGLWGEIQRKMKINRARKWRLMGDGTGYHIKPAPPSPNAGDGSQDRQGGGR